ncbi:AAA family ATPase [Bdellovibrionota bacterium FG-2]
MPHLRKRYLTSIIQHTLKASAILGIIGQRQTGKSTLVENLVNEYVTLDDEKQLELALRSPQSFLEGRKAPFGIDECQMSPPLFSALKEHVRRIKVQGQFILTGSVRFTSVEEIRESLTGRMIDLELLPFCLTEAHNLPLTDLRRLATSTNPVPHLETLALDKERIPLMTPHALEEFLIKGGLPGICFIRSGSLRTRKMRSHLKTLLDRDLRKVIRTDLDYLTIKTFVEELVLQQGLAFDLTQAAKGARIAINSARKLLNGLESIFMVRTLRKEGDTSGRVVFFEDQGMASFLLAERGRLFKSGQPQVADYVRLLFQQLNAQAMYRSDLHTSLFSYMSRGGAIIDLAVRLEEHVCGFSVGVGQQASLSQMKSAESFRRKFPQARVFLLHQGSEFRTLKHQTFEVPFKTVL